jgi:hypothetical protein
MRGKSFPKKGKPLPNCFLDKIKNQEEDGSHGKTNFHCSTCDPNYEIGLCPITVPRGRGSLKGSFSICFRGANEKEERLSQKTHFPPS